jgi:hypothetical protein
MKIRTPMLEQVALDHVLDVIGARVHHIGMNAGLGVIMLPGSFKFSMRIEFVFSVACIPQDIFPTFVVFHVGVGDVVGCGFVIVWVDCLLMWQ